MNEKTQPLFNLNPLSAPAPQPSEGGPRAVTTSQDDGMLLQREVEVVPAFNPVSGPNIFSMGATQQAAPQPTLQPAPTEVVDEAVTPTLPTPPLPAESPVTPIFATPEPVVAPASPVYQHENSEIQSVLHEHAEWVNSGGRSGRRANFRQANLHGMQLTGAFLPEASFRGADLSDTNLSGSDLRGADLSEAVLSGTNLSYANLGGAVLNHGDLRSTHLEGADLQGADLGGALLTGAQLSQVNFANASLLEADLQHAHGEQAVFTGANLRAARLSHGNFAGADFSQSNCRDADFSQAILDHALFTGASLRNAVVQGASLIATDLSNAAEGSADNRQESVQLEKEQIAQEWAKLKTEQAAYQQQFQSVQQREMTLQGERQQVELTRRDLQGQTQKMESLLGEASVVMQAHRRHDSALRILGLVWFVFTVLVVAGLLLLMQQLDLQSLNVVELGIVVGTSAVVLVVFVLTTVRAVKMSNNMRRFTSLFDQHFPGRAVR